MLAMAVTGVDAAEKVFGPNGLCGTGSAADVRTENKILEETEGKVDIKCLSGGTHQGVDNLMGRVPVTLNPTHGFMSGFILEPRVKWRSVRGSPPICLNSIRDDSTSALRPANQLTVTLIFPPVHLSSLSVF